MGVIVNPRGTNGAGKTELARRIMALYGWDGGRKVERIYREGRSRPICYRLEHPLGGRPLAVLGHYERVSGGCDTIGSMDEVFRLARDQASAGHDVLFEGLLVSSEERRSAELARAHRLHVLRLSTPPDQCVRNVTARRRARKAIRPLVAQIAAGHHVAIDDACSGLRYHAQVEVASFNQALVRSQELFGLARPNFGGARPLAARAVHSDLSDWSSSSLT